MSFQIELEYDKGVALVMIKDTNRKNTGKYEITAKNACATKVMDFKLQVLDKPGPPEGPIKFSALTNEKVTLWWRPCKENGGAAVESFVVEKRETTRLNWAVV